MKENPGHTCLYLYFREVDKYLPLKLHINTLTHFKACYLWLSINYKEQVKEINKPRDSRRGHKEMDKGNPRPSAYQSQNAPHCVNFMDGNSWITQRSSVPSAPTSPLPSECCRSSCLCCAHLPLICTDKCLMLQAGTSSLITMVPKGIHPPVQLQLPPGQASMPSSFPCHLDGNSLCLKFQASQGCKPDS